MITHLLNNPVANRLLDRLTRWVTQEAGMLSWFYCQGDFWAWIEEIGWRMEHTPAEEEQAA